MITIEPNEFRQTRFTHEDVDSLMKERGVSKRRYTSNHMSKAYPDTSTRVYDAELALAREAIAVGYEFVSNLDYCSNCIAARGWKRNA